MKSRQVCKECYAFIKAEEYRNKSNEDKKATYESRKEYQKQYRESNKNKNKIYMTEYHKTKKDY